MLWICVVAFLKEQDNKVNGSPKIGAFRSQLLGNGNNGNIYSIEKNGLDLACKSCSYLVGPDNESQYKRFKNEHAFLMELRHPNIIELNHVWEEDYCDNLGLELCIGDVGKSDMSIEILQNLLMYMLKALKYMHSKDIYHGDIKPQNILYKNDKERTRFILTDFESASKSKEGPIPTYGTMNFLPTEVIGRINKADGFEIVNQVDKQRMDIYALGKTLFYFVMCERDIKCMVRHRGSCFLSINGLWQSYNFFQLPPEQTFSTKVLNYKRHPLKRYIFKMMSCDNNGLSAENVLTMIKLKEKKNRFNKINIAATSTAQDQK